MILFRLLSLSSAVIKINWTRVNALNLTLFLQKETEHSHLMKRWYTCHRQYSRFSRALDVVTTYNRGSQTSQKQLRKWLLRDYGSKVMVNHTFPPRRICGHLWRWSTTLRVRLVFAQEFPGICNLLRKVSQGMRFETP